jgi:chemotaxis protein methyltransferase CheR
MIAERMGLHIAEDRWSKLYMDLAAAAPEFGFNDLNEFMNWMLTKSLTQDQIEVLASYLTISETYFWREPQAFEAFSQYVLPELMKSKKETEKSISIWCAACSTGEEAYSIAIALHRSIPDIKDWKITIIATDINACALSKARKGIYSSWSFRNSPSWLKSKYFTSHNNKEYSIIPRIKKMVTFTSFNLTDENFLHSICKDRKMDIIFCRNVLMYFTDEWAERISKNLYSSLSEKGWLIVSSCELSSSLFPNLSPVNFTGAVLYQKSEKEPATLNQHKYDLKFQPSVKEFAIPGPEGLATNKSLEIAALPEIQDKVENRDIESIYRANSKINDPLKSKSLLKSHEEILNENKNSIRTLANMGRLEEANLICNDAIDSDKLAPSLYFLRASILQELNKNQEAINSLKQAIFIDPNYLMGHFTLGNLYIGLGNTKNAKRYFNNALDLLNTLSKDEIFTESEGLSPEYLKEIILSNLKK